MSGLSQEALNRLLAWLDEDRARAAEKYEQIRARLIKFFLDRNSKEAEALTDKTIDRVVNKLAEFEPEYPVNPIQYFLAVAWLMVTPSQPKRESSKDDSVFEVKEQRRNISDDDVKWSGKAGGGDFLGFARDQPERRLPRRPPSSQPAPKKAAPRQSRIVSTGFSSLDQPDDPIDLKSSLKTATNYYFWFQIGEQQKGSIETTPTEIPSVPVNARLTVVLFKFKDSLQIVPGADVGYLEVQGSGSVEVLRQPQQDGVTRSRKLDQRLFFPVRTPTKAGVYRMRCNIYWGQTLLQSRIIEARITTSPTITKSDALRSVLDYKISQQLDPSHITKLNDHRLSVLLNKNDDGSHSFHFYGAEGQAIFKQDDVRFDAGELDGMLTQARGTLRLASWGDAEEWRQGVAYKYRDRKPKLDRLKEDLLNLAKWGYEFYTQIRSRLAGGEDAVETFEQLLRQPGSIQFAMKESPRYILPAALIYDHPLDTAAENHSLCQSFVDAFTKADSLEALECLSGNCPTREDITTLCPSGFWGFRHYLGLPLSVKNGPDAASEISVNGDLKVAVGVATDLQLLKTHSASMQKLKSKLIWNDADNRDGIFQLLKDSPHIVYFYCHGGLVRNAPYLQLGPKEKPSLIQRSNFYAHKIKWKEPRPLVFINGCHTTAVAPTQALEFITPLVTYSNCAGVIGTEITIFEELATVFAEDCLGRFLRGDPIGKAIRNARLKLLKEGNPLGLVYIPFVMSGLSIVDKTLATPSNQ